MRIAPFLGEKSDNEIRVELRVRLLPTSARGILHSSDVSKIIEIE